MWFYPGTSWFQDRINSAIAGDYGFITDLDGWKWLKTTDIYPVEEGGYMNYLLDLNFICIMVLGLGAPLIALAAPALIVLLMAWIVCYIAQYIYLLPTSWPV